MKQSRVVEHRPDPADPKRRILTLDCGHECSRRMGKRSSRAICGECARK